MAKRMTRNRTLTARGYRLTMLNSGSEFGFDLTVAASDGAEYHLRIEGANDRTELLQAALHKLAELWPAFDWQFRGNSRGQIVKIL